MGHTQLESAPADLSPAVLVAHVNHGYRTAFGDALDDMSAVDRPTCVFAAVNLRTGLVVRVGDCSWVTPARTEVGSMKIDDIAIAMRVAHTRMWLLAGAEVADLAFYDPGRELLFPALRKQGVLRNNVVAGDLGYGAIDGVMPDERFIESWQLRPDEGEVALASDGYPRLFLTLAETEEYLVRDLADDPLRIGRHPGIKGLAPDAVSFDDRSYLALRRTGPAAVD